MHRILLCMALSALFISTAAATATAKVQGKEVDYTDGRVKLKGYLAYDARIKGKRPGVLVVHEWWGLNDYARKRANMLAELGYTALAVDMYGNGRQATHPDEATKFSSELMKNFDVAKARFMAALNLLKRQPTVDPGRIAAIGYCFGGGVVLNMARQGVPLKGVVSFHGNLTPVKPATPGSVKAKILVLQGGADKLVPPEQVRAFEKEMGAAGADFQVIVYPGAKHSFTNPEADSYAKKYNLPLGYSPDADKESWAAMKKFLADVFAGQPTGAGVKP